MQRPELARRHSLYAPSNVLVTIRNQDTLAIFDFEAGELVWAWGQGELLRPHDATILANGNILVFDNRTGEDASRVVELDPITREIVWEYPHGGAPDFYSGSRGTVQRLPNGNTLIGESNRGRGFEVTPEGDVVWDYRTPHRNEESQPAALRVERYLTSENLPD
jgi:outer membrane protein assembly factor BamB